MGCELGLRAWAGQVVNGHLRSAQYRIAIGASGGQVQVLLMIEAGMIGAVIGGAAAVSVAWAAVIGVLIAIF